jgi:hypothetical protein
MYQLFKRPGAVSGFLIGLCLFIGHPAAASIDSMKVRHFIIKSFITLTNSKPAREQIPQICRRFNLYQDFDAGASQLLDSLLQTEAFSQCIFDRFRYEYLQGASLAEIYNELEEFKANLNDSSYRSQYTKLKDYENRLSKVATAATDLKNGSIDIPEMQRRFFDNIIYQEINMGPDNFINSTFNHLFFRNPTAAELKDAKEMYKGNRTWFFFKTGEGHPSDDYLQALISSSAYWEGQVRYWYRILLNRDATVQEMLTGCSGPRNVKALIKDILRKREFAGL